MYWAGTGGGGGRNTGRRDWTDYKIKNKNPDKNMEN